MQTINPRLKPAHLGKRFVAHIFDLVMILGIWMFAAIVMLLIIKVVARKQIEAFTDDPSLLDTGLPFLVLVIVFFLIILLSIIFHFYFITYEFKHAQTPGKKMMKIKVVQIDGSPITRQQAIRRDFAKVYFELMLTVPLLYVFMNPLKQRLGDKWSNTLVIEAE